MADVVGAQLSRLAVSDSAAEWLIRLGRIRLLLSPSHDQCGMAIPSGTLSAERQ